MRHTLLGLRGLGSIRLRQGFLSLREWRILMRIISEGKT